MFEPERQQLFETRYFPANIEEYLSSLRWKYGLVLQQPNPEFALLHIIVIGMVVHLKHLGENCRPL